MSCCSLEIFAPRSSAGVDELLRSRLAEFAKRGPKFISVSGTVASGALRIAEDIRAKYCIRPQLHVQRAGSTTASITALLDALLGAGVHDVLLLGGEPGTLNKPAGGEFGSTAEMVSFIKGRYGEQIKVAVCGFPRGTLGEAGEYAADLAELSKQVAAGAESVVCLPVFEAHAFAAFVSDLAKAGLGCPVLPGLLPLREASEFHRMCRALHVTPPAWLVDQLSENQAAAAFGDSLFCSLVSELKQMGHSSPHVYTLNAASTLSLMDSAGYKPLAHRAASR